MNEYPAGSLGDRVIYPYINLSSTSHLSGSLKAWCLFRHLVEWTDHACLLVEPDGKPEADNAITCGFSQMQHSPGYCLLADPHTWNKYAASGARPPMITCLVNSSALKVEHLPSDWPPFSQYVITRLTPESPSWNDHSILTVVLFSRLIFTSGWPISGSNSQT